MDGSKPTPISAQDLYRSIGTAVAPVVIDVRREAAFAADNRMIPGAIRRNPDEIPDWRQDLTPGRAVVVYCAHGQEVSQRRDELWRTRHHGHNANRDSGKASVDIQTRFCRGACTGQYVAGAGGDPARDIYRSRKGRLDWRHSYHIDYGARAAAYVDAFIEVIRWENPAQLYDRYSAGG
jgi:hypothetical protein